MSAHTCKHNDSKHQSEERKNHAYHRRVIKIIQMTMHQLVTHFITHFMNKQIIIVYMIAVVRINIYEFKFKI